MVLATARVLHRPWCLLEIHEAVKSSIPVLIVQVAGGGFDFTEATGFISSLEHELEQVNPGAVDEIVRFLADRASKPVREDGSASVDGDCSQTSRTRTVPTGCSCALPESSLSREAVLDTLKRSLLSALTRGQFIEVELESPRTYVRNQLSRRTSQRGAQKQVRVCIDGQEASPPPVQTSGVRHLASFTALGRRLSELFDSARGTSRRKSIVSATAVPESEEAAPAVQGGGAPPPLLTKAASKCGSTHASHVEIECCLDEGATQPALNGAGGSSTFSTGAEPSSHVAGAPSGGPKPPGRRKLSGPRCQPAESAGRSWLAPISSRFTRDEDRSTTNSRSTGSASRHSSFWPARFSNNEDGRALRPKVTQRLVWHPHGSDNQVLADVDDLVTRMAEVTGRTLRWRPPLSSVQEQLEASTSSRSSSWRKSACRGPTEGPKEASARQHDAAPLYAAFISYHRGEAMSDARFIQGRLRELMGLPIFLDADASSQEDEYGILINGVARSATLVLLQSKNVLTSPWVLLEVFMALRNGVPVIPVLLNGRGYDFDDAKAFLADLPAQLEQRSPGGLEELQTQLRRLNAYERLRMTVQQVQSRLSDTVPNKISVHFNPAGTENQVHASIRDLHDRLLQGTPRVHEVLHSARRTQRNSSFGHALNAVASYMRRATGDRRTDATDRRSS